MEPLQPNEIKQNLLHLLEAIAVFCDEKGICYFLAWGTLLGAVRHKGFIPWDDDIDIWMPRPDYNRFVREFRHRTYVFRSMEKEEDWPLCFGKVCDMNYQACDEFGHDYGLYVDVFPLDGLPDDEMQRERHIATVRRKERMWSSQVLTRKLSLSKAYPLSKNLSIIAARFLHPFYPERKVIGDLLKEYQRYSWEDSSIVTDFHERRVFKKDVFLPAMEVPFESLVCKKPCDTTGILQALYGDFMTPPPESERYNHGITTVLKKDKSSLLAK